MTNLNLPNGIIGVLQTPFDDDNQIDWQSLEALIEDSIASGIDGFLTPAVASEVSTLSKQERTDHARFVDNVVNKRAALILGTSSETIDDTKTYAKIAEELEYDAFLLPVHETFYQSPEYLLPYLQMITPFARLPYILQDLHWQGGGLPVSYIASAKENSPTLQGIKIETIPAGPKYTRVRDELGEDFFISGGWAVPQMIEAMDRGINALMPECSMIRIYKTIWNQYQTGKRDAAISLFHKLLPILSYTNQEINTSIAFFKRLLVRRGIFSTEIMRVSAFSWDTFNTRITDELIERYFELESECKSLNQ